MSRVSLLVVSLASAISSAEQLYSLPMSAASLLGKEELVGREDKLSIINYQPLFV